MRCEDCRGPMTGTPDETRAIAAGVRICQGCIDLMERERDAYEQIMRDEGYRCVFDPEFSFRAVPLAPAGEGG